MTFFFILSINSAHLSFYSLHSKKKKITSSYYERTKETLMYYSDVIFRSDIEIKHLDLTNTELFTHAVLPLMGFIL